MAGHTFHFHTTGELNAMAVDAPRWLWEDFLRSGMVTLFSSRWKIGKTTLIAKLLSLMGDGGELAGSSVAKGTALVASEETRDLWAERCRHFGIGDHVSWVFRPFRGLPTAEDASAFLSRLAERPADLYVIDPLAMFLPAYTENTASGVFAALEPLHRLTETGAAVVLLHHPKKGDSKEFSHRGSGALTGLADVLVEMTTPQAATVSDRRRILRATSRLRSPLSRLIELDETGRNYSVLTEAPREDSYETNWQILKMILEGATMRLTRKGILSSWPDDFDKPAATTLRRWLERAEKEGTVTRFGTGHNDSPFRYALPGKKFDRFSFVPVSDFDTLLREQYGD